MSIRKVATPDDGPWGFRDLQAMAAPRPAPKPAYVWQKFPHWMNHPDFVEAIPAKHETIMVESSDGIQLPHLEFLTTPAIMLNHIV